MGYYTENMSLGIERQFFCWKICIRDCLEYDSKVRCVIFVSKIKNIFSQIFPSPLAEISNLALSAKLMFLKYNFSDRHKFGFYLNISTGLSQCHHVAQLRISD